MIELSLFILGLVLSLGGFLFLAAINRGVRDHEVPQAVGAFLSLVICSIGVLIWFLFYDWANTRPSEPVKGFDFTEECHQSSEEDYAILKEKQLKEVKSLIEAFNTKDAFVHKIASKQMNLFWDQEDYQRKAAKMRDADPSYVKPRVGKIPTEDDSLKNPDLEKEIVRLSYILTTSLDYEDRLLELLREAVSELRYKDIPLDALDLLKDDGWY